jgi:O-antigen ligase
MNPALQKGLLGIYSLLFAACAAAAGYYQQMALLAAPAGVATIWFLLQYPHYLYYLLMAAIPWSIEYNLTASLGTDFPDEQLMWVCSAAALILAAYRFRSISLRRLHPLLILLLLQFVWLCITVVLSTDVVLSLKHLAAKTWYLLSFIVLPLFLLKNEEVLQRCVIVLTASMLLFMYYALWRHAQLGFTFEDINKALEPYYRNHVNYSALLVFMVPLLILFIRNTAVTSSKIFLSGILLITIAALYLSYARGAWLALLLSFFIPFLLRKNLLVKAFAAALIVVVLSVAILAWNNNYLKFAPRFNTTIFHTNFKEHLVATYQLEDVSTAERYHRWIAAVRMGKDSWLTGFGPNTFYDNYKSYTIPAFKTWVSRNEERSTVHNYFLFLLVEQGVLGMLLFVALLGALFWYLQRLYRHTADRFVRYKVIAIASILTMVCVVNFLSDMIETDKVGSVFYLCVTVTVLFANQNRSGASIKRIRN